MLALIGILLVFGLCFVGLIGFIFFVRWALRQHGLARQYQSQITAASVTGPSWTIQYKVGQKVMTSVIFADTEPKAVLEFVKTSSVGYDKIMSVTRN